METRKNEEGRTTGPGIIEIHRGVTLSGLISEVEFFSGASVSKMTSWNLLKEISLAVTELMISSLANHQDLGSIKIPPSKIFIH